MTNETNKISAANGMQLTNLTIQYKGPSGKRQVVSDQEIIRDTLETTDRQTNSHYLKHDTGQNRENVQSESGQRLNLLG